MKTPTIREVSSLLVALKKCIESDYRCSDDPFDNKPGMQVTIGASPDGSWDYQTGDNSYYGGAYGHRHWGVIYLYRDSNCRALAGEAIAEIADQVYFIALADALRRERPADHWNPNKMVQWDLDCREEKSNEKDPQNHLKP